MKSQNWGTVICSECGTRVSIDDAESCYNAELDDVYFVCTKCIEDENRQSPAVSDDSDEAVEHGVQRIGETVPLPNKEPDIQELIDDQVSDFLANR